MAKILSINATIVKNIDGLVYLELIRFSRVRTTIDFVLASNHKNVEFKLANPRNAEESKMRFNLLNVYKTATAIFVKASLKDKDKVSIPLQGYRNKKEHFTAFYNNAVNDYVCIHKDSYHRKHLSFLSSLDSNFLCNRDKSVMIDKELNKLETFEFNELFNMFSNKIYIDFSTVIVSNIEQLLGIEQLIYIANYWADSPSLWENIRMVLYHKYNIKQISWYCVGDYPITLEQHNLVRKYIVNINFINNRDRSSYSYIDYSLFDLCSDISNLIGYDRYLYHNNILDELKYINTNATNSLQFFFRFMVKYAEHIPATQVGKDFLTKIGDGK